MLVGVPLSNGGGELLDRVGEVLALAAVAVQLALLEERQLHLHQCLRLEVVVQVTGLDRFRNPLLGRLALGWPELLGRKGDLPTAREIRRDQVTLGQGLQGSGCLRGKVPGPLESVGLGCLLGIAGAAHREAARRAFSSGVVATIVGCTARRDAGIRTTAAGCAAVGLSASAGVARR